MKNKYFISLRTKSKRIKSTQTTTTKGTTQPLIILLSIINSLDLERKKRVYSLEYVKWLFYIEDASFFLCVCNESCKFILFPLQLQLWPVFLHNTSSILFCRASVDVCCLFCFQPVLLFVNERNRHNFKMLLILL